MVDNATDLEVSCRIIVPEEQVEKALEFNRQHRWRQPADDGGIKSDLGVRSRR